DKKVAGVSGGLGAYLGVDPLLIRIGFVVTALTSGLGLIAYLAMLILVPADALVVIGDEVEDRRGEAAELLEQPAPRLGVPLDLRVLLVGQRGRPAED